MKVIFITREGYGLSGARIRCYGFARELKKFRIDTEVFSFADHLGAEYGENEAKMGIRKKLLFNFRALDKLRSKIDRESIIFMQRLNYHSIAPFAISLLNKNRVIFDCDDWDVDENPVYYLGFYPASKMDYLTKKMARYSQVCTAASHFLRSYLKDFSRKIYYIPTGVDTGLFNPSNNKSPDAKIVLSWIGTAYHKEMGENIKFLLDCFMVLTGRHDNIFLDLMGQGKYFEEARNTPIDSSLRDKVRFYSWISPDKVPAYLKNIDIGLLPLIQDTKFNRSKSPTKLFEYMAMAKPTVSSDIGEAAYIIRDGESGFLAKKKEDFIGKIDLLINDPSLREDIGENARKVVHNTYSLEILGRQLYEIIKTIPQNI